MKFIYHAGTGTYITIDDDVYVVDEDDMTETELVGLEEGDEVTVFEFVIESGRATRLREVFGGES